jgi:aryl-alcohol dehydrogenase-like predicted oxidoreductase
MIPWSPLARGRLARPRDATTTRSQTDAFGVRLYASMEEADGRVQGALDALAKARKVPHAQIALAWLLQKDGVTSPIVGATKMHHLEDAAAAVALALSPEEVRSLEAPYVPHFVAGHG